MLLHGIKYQQGSYNTARPRHMSAGPACAWHALSHDELLDSLWLFQCRCTECVELVYGMQLSWGHWSLVLISIDAAHPETVQ